MKNKHSFLSVLIMALVCMLNSCNPRSSYSPALVKADSLLEQRYDEAAYKLLMTINSDSLSERDRYYYDLLMTQAQYKNYMPFTSDSIINCVANYYKQQDEVDKYTKALIFQGCVNEELGNYTKAVHFYSKAENCIPDTSCYWMAYTKMRLAYIYQEQIIGSSTIALQEFKEANTLFNKIHDSHYELLCIGEIGNIYRSMPEKGDSAVFFIEKAIQLSKQQNEPYLYFSNCFKLAEYYSEITHEYNKAKLLAQRALSVDADLIDHPRAHLCLATCYMELNRYDSAQYYIKNIPPLTSRIDSMWYYHTMSKFEEHNDNYHKSIEYYKKSHNLSDSMVVNSLNAKLLEIKRKCDKKEGELENERLQSGLNHTLFLLAVTVLVAVLLGATLLRYRRKLNDKKEEYVMLTTDLNNSLAKMNKMQETIDGFGSKTDKWAELHDVINSQVNAIHELVLLSHELPEGKFLKKFQDMMAVSRDESNDNAAYWNHLQLIANELHGGIIDKAVEQATDSLRKDEINFLSLFCCGYSNTGIMVCMHYTNIRTVYNKKRNIADKLGVKTLEEFVKQHK